MKKVRINKNYTFFIDNSPSWGYIQRFGINSQAYRMNLTKNDKIKAFKAVCVAVGVEVPTPAKDILKSPDLRLYHTFDSSLFVYVEDEKDFFIGCQKTTRKALERLAEVMAEDLGYVIFEEEVA